MGGDNDGLADVGLVDGDGSAVGVVGENSGSDEPVGEFATEDERCIWLV